jgi:hypothetical protein
MWRGSPLDVERIEAEIRRLDGQRGTDAPSP